MRRNCPACGERYEGSVCPKCGYTPAPRKHGGKDAETQNKFLTDEQRTVQARVLEERRKDSRILIIVIVIAVLAAAFVLYPLCYTATERSEETTKSLLQTISTLSVKGISRRM